MQQQQQQQQQPDAQAQSTTTRPTLQSAYFDQILERGRKRNAAAGALPDVPGLQLGLGDIARKARNLGAADAPKAGDTKAHYLLAASGVSTAAALRDLNAFSAQAGAAAVPVASGGFSDTDIESFVSNIQAQSTLDMIQEGLEQSKRDFDTFLEDNVQMNWDAQRRRIYEHFGLAKPSEQEQESAGGADPTDRGAFGRSARRSKIGGSTMAFGQSGLNKSILGNSSARATFRASSFEGAEKTQMTLPPVEDRFQRDKQERYAATVKDLNACRNRELCYPVIHKFAEVEEQAGLDNTASLISAYQALASITGEPNEIVQSFEARAAKERKFAADYLDENSNSRKSIELRKRIIDGSRRCLEKIFLKKIEDTIAKDPKVANLGGIPSPVNKIRAYIRVLSSRKELAASDNINLQSITEGSNEDYCWVILYFMLRAGLVKEAAQYVADNIKAIRTIDRKFCQYIERYAADEDRRLPQDMRQSINSEYSQRTKIAAEDTFDPYRMACYKLVGRCELSRRALDNIRTDEDDWMWLQFALAREVNRAEEAAGEVFGLEQIREMVAEIGRRLFAPGSENSPGGLGLLFFLQILSGMFEQAVATLYPTNHVAAVHFAIALAYYGLLRVADLSATDLLSFNTRQQPRIHFALMVGYYTGDFRVAQPDAAADYLILLCLNADLPGEAGVQQAKLCHEGLRELVLETREFAQLLGDVRADGARLPGAIETRLKLIRIPGAAATDTQQFVHTLTVQAAAAADDNGRTTDAVLLYHLANEYDRVISIINRTLSEALTTELGHEPMHLEPLKPRAALAANSTLSLTAVSDPAQLARNMTDLYQRDALVYTQIRPVARDACVLLLRLWELRGMVERQQWQAALENVEALGLLPLNARGNVGAIRATAANFDELPEPVARVIGDVLMWTIVACGQQREALRSEGWNDRGRKEAAMGLEQGARDLMIYAGLIRFKLPPRVMEVIARVGGDVGV
ncbi:nuclear pore protein [Trichodelitschia bisporula]|uniref:Nuclear pore protein n=1 Tax=Trichodelitschia bisporula TaxID=703511 RepID=A0A6G1HRN3_9PEZI|nr:nuclear pore protein [Trichodelitschia bisporula]